MELLTESVDKRSSVIDLAGDKGRSVRVATVVIDVSGVTLVKRKSRIRGRWIKEDLEGMLFFLIFDT